MIIELAGISVGTQILQSKEKINNARGKSKSLLKVGSGKGPVTKGDRVSLEYNVLSRHEEEVKGVLWLVNKNQSKSG